MRLTRKPSQSVELFRGGEKLGKITLCEIKPGRVVLDITCPLSVEIIRSEIIDRETSPDAIETE